MEKSFKGCTIFYVYLTSLAVIEVTALIIGSLQVNLASLV